jgi:homoserine dehydrogenase
MTTFELLMVGFGHVGQRFVTLLEDQRAILAREYGLTTRVVGIATRRHGRISTEGGLDAVSIIDRVMRGEVLGGCGVDQSTGEFIRDLTSKSAATGEGRFVIVETTTLDIASGQPAIDHVRAGLGSGAHVVTANKGPVAFAYRTLAEEARRAGRRFLFEGAVMDGVPVFNLVRETLPGIEIIGFRGVVNSTTNYILTAMEEGQSFERALADMQAAGIAEADASLDVEGWDAAAKAAALANVLLDGQLTPHAVERRGISAATGARAAAARAAGRRLKLVATAGREGGRVTARVSPEELPGDDLLAGLEGQQNAIVFHTDLLGEIAVVQRGGGLTQTAYALLADLVTIAREVNDQRPAQRPQP